MQLPSLTWLEGRPDWIKDFTVSIPDRQVARLPWGEVPFSTPSTERWLVGQGRLFRVLANPSVALGNFWGIGGNTMTYMNALRIFPGMAQLGMAGKALAPASGYTGGPSGWVAEAFNSSSGSYTTSTLEVADKEAEAVPEPTTILGSIAGLGMLVGMAKRRRASR